MSNYSFNVHILHSLLQLIFKILFFVGKMLFFMWNWYVHYCTTSHVASTDVLFHRALNDYHRLTTHPLKRNCRDKKTGALWLNGMFFIKCLSSEALACFNPTITPLERRLWLVEHPTYWKPCRITLLSKYTRILASCKEWCTSCCQAVYRSPCSNKVWWI